DGSCVRLDAESLARFRVLDLGALMEAGAISDVRGIGLASFLECGRMGFAEAWGYLARHPAFVGHFPECFSFAPTAVCPETLCVEDDAALNTRTRVRVRGGAWAEFAGAIVDDISLVTSGWTFEEAVCNLAEAVRRTYGDDFAPFCVDAG
ncbi:MAG: hypothetical protein J6D54_11215, partial [Olsenella sp.]|nr:hypothetical protein [Olsenella sp.]